MLTFGIVFNTTSRRSVPPGSLQPHPEFPDSLHEALLDLIEHHPDPLVSDTTYALYRAGRLSIGLESIGNSTEMGRLQLYQTPRGSVLGLVVNAAFLSSPKASTCNKQANILHECVHVRQFLKGRISAGMLSGLAHGEDELRQWYESEVEAHQIAAEFMIRNGCASEHVTAQAFANGGRDSLRLAVARVYCNPDVVSPEAYDIIWDQASR